MGVPRIAKLITLAGSVALVTGAVCQLSWRAPLPCYELRLEGGRATYLDSQRVQALDAQSRLSIILRPELAVTRSVFVGAIVKEQSRQIAWPVLFDHTRQGTLLLQGPLRELRLPCQRRCTVTLYVSDFLLLPALLWLVPPGYRGRLLPRTQTLQAHVLIEPPVVVLGR